MGHGLPDIYTLILRASGVYIRQITRAHGKTITYVATWILYYDTVL